MKNIQELYIFAFSIIFLFIFLFDILFGVEVRKTTKEMLKLKKEHIRLKLFKQTVKIMELNK